jgi:hypothetical protein
MKWQVLVAVLSLSLVGCGDDDEGSPPIASGPLTGQVGGEAWTFVSGRSDSFLSDPDDLWIDLFDESSEGCEPNAASGNSILLITPRKVGEFSLGGLQANATFFVASSSGGENYIAEGRLKVLEVTTTTLRGGLDAYYDGGNSINGEFEATICP